MNDCRLEELSEVALGEGSPGTLAHVATCPACAARLEGLRRTVGRLAAARPAPLAVAFDARRAPARTRPLSGLALALALVAVPVAAVAFRPPVVAPVAPVPSPLPSPLPVPEDDPYTDIKPLAFAAHPSEVLDPGSDLPPLDGASASELERIARGLVPEDADADAFDRYDASLPVVQVERLDADAVERALVRLAAR